jgi:hypothetical protein
MNNPPSVAVTQDDVAAFPICDAFCRLDRIV